MLAHRIGLIPLKADPKDYDFVGPDNVQTNKNTIVLHLDVSCPQPPDTLSPEQKHMYSFNALSGSLQWSKPLDEEEGESAKEVRPVHPDIVLATMKPGQHMEFEAHAVKGIGAPPHTTHTRPSSPAHAALMSSRQGPREVQPCIYRLVPLAAPCAAEAASRRPTCARARLAHSRSFASQPDMYLTVHDIYLFTVKMCPMKVFDIEDIGGVSTATVARPRDCTMCRECIRKDDWSERVELRRVADHFIFSVESVGIMPPAVIVREAISVLQDKAIKYQQYVEYTMQQGGDV